VIGEVFRAARGRVVEAGSVEVDGAGFVAHMERHGGKLGRFDEGAREHVLTGVLLHGQATRPIDGAGDLTQAGAGPAPCAAPIRRRLPDAGNARATQLARVGQLAARFRIEERAVEDDLVGVGVERATKPPWPRTPSGKAGRDTASAS
jgi:hypothetical protein